MSRLYLVRSFENEFLRILGKERETGVRGERDLEARQPLEELGLIREVGEKWEEGRGGSGGSLNSPPPSLRKAEGRLVQDSLVARLAPPAGQGIFTELMEQVSSMTSEDSSNWRTFSSGESREISEIPDSMVNDLVWPWDLGTGAMST